MLGDENFSGFSLGTTLTNGQFFAEGISVIGLGSHRGGQPSHSQLSGQRIDSSRECGYHPGTVTFPERAITPSLEASKFLA